MTDKVKHNFSMALLIVIVIFAVLVGSFFIWLLRPYPSVTVTGISTVTNLPASGEYRTGDVIRWTTEEVCQPDGVTEAQVYAVLVFDTEFGEALSKTPLTTREFTIPEGFPNCVKDNPTTAYVDGNLPTGTYRFEIEACVYNPTPRPVCKTFQGPSDVRIRRVAGNE